MTNRRHRLLLFIENAEFGSVLAFALPDCETAIFVDADRARDAFSREPFDIAIVDASAENQSAATELIRDWRTADSSISLIAISDIPYIGLAVEALEAGADDFLRKPFHHAELRARIRRLLERPAAPGPRRADGVALGESGFYFGGAEVTPNLILKFSDGAQERIRPKHFGILKAFAVGAGRLVLKEDLVKAVWGSPARGHGNSVNEYISNLRRLFFRHGIDLNRWITSEPKAGWRIHAEAASPAAQCLA